MEMSCALCSRLSLKKNIFRNTDEAKDHALLHYRQVNFLDDHCLVSEDEIFDQCFLTDTKPKNASDSGTKWHQRQLYPLCRLLFNDRSNIRVGCNVCALVLKAYHQKYLRCEALIAHACTHLAVRLFQCLLCGKSVSAQHTISNHCWQAHKTRLTSDVFQDLSEQYQKEIKAALKKCFGKGVLPTLCEKVDQRNVTKASELAANRQLFCNGLIKKAAQSDGKVKCNICAERTTAKRGVVFVSHKVIQHAYLHLRKPLYRCKVCNDTSSTYKGTHHHLNLKHALGMENNHEFSGADYHEDILAMLMKCYGHKDTIQLAGDSTAFFEERNRVRGERLIRGRVKGSELTIKRHVFCNGILRKNVEADGKIACRLCSSRIRAKTKQALCSQNTMLHVHSHLQKPIYQCNVCQSACNTFMSMRTHLKRMHNFGLKSNYECLEDKYHEDILDLLSRCFGGGAGPSD